MSKNAKAIRIKLLVISAKEQVAFQNIQTNFLLERMVERLTRNKDLFEKIIFKGGYVALRVFNSPRYTIDLDALIENAGIKETKTTIVEAIEQDLRDGTWFKYEKDADLVTLGEYEGTRLYFRCGIGIIPVKYQKAQAIHLDLAVGDVVTPGPLTHSLLSLVDEEPVSWKIYTLESMTAEKLHTLLIRMSDNSRAKDVYDLYHFLPKCQMDALKKALLVTFSARGDTFPKSFSKIVSQINTDLLERGWKNATIALVEKISFEDAFKRILASCKVIDAIQF